MRLKLLFALFVFIPIFSFGQSRHQLVYDCAVKPHTGIYLRDFNTRLKSARPGKKSGTEWTVKLNKNTIYRFNLCASHGIQEYVVMKLYEEKRSEACPLLEVNVDENIHDFYCLKTGLYYVSIRSNQTADDKFVTGVGAGILSYAGKSSFENTNISDEKVFVSIPISYSTKNEVKVLILADQKTNKFPSALLKLTNLHTLSIEAIKTQADSADFSKLKELKHLELTKCDEVEFDKIVSSVEQVPKLETLRLSGWGISETRKRELIKKLPESIKIKMVYEIFDNKDSLTSQDLEKVRIYESFEIANSEPDYVYRFLLRKRYINIKDFLEFKNLYHLELYYCKKIRNLDKINELSKLQKITFYYSRFNTLPKEIYNAKNLKEIEIVGSFPEEQIKEIEMELKKKLPNCKLVVE